MLSIIVVNYNSTQYFTDLVRSIRSARYPGGFVEQILVVENGSCAEQRAALETFEDSLVRGIFLDESSSFSAANNLALKQATGTYICLLNPDTLVRDESLKVMVEYLAANPDVSAVGPRLWLDKLQTIMMPPNELPSPAQYFRNVISRLSPTFAFKDSLRRTRYASRFWHAEEPQEIEMLCGACIMAPAETFQRIGGLDERFPLYFEDADWSLRVRKAGGKLVYFPRANITHLYNKSAGQDYSAALRKNAISEKVYFKKHYPLTYLTLPLVKALQRRPLPNITLGNSVDLGEQVVPYQLDLSDVPADCTLEVSPSPSFEVAAAAPRPAGALRFPKATWRNLAGQDWFIRAVALDGTTVNKNWRIRVRPSAVEADWSLVSYQPGDENDILRLFKDVFDADRSVEEWQWIYRDNPNGQRIVLAKNTRQELIANYSGIPVRVKYFDEEFCFSQPVDTMVRRDYRGGLNSRSLIKEITLKYYERFGSKETDAAMYGLPNEAAWKVGLSKLGYEPLDPIVYLTKPIPQQVRSEEPPNGVSLQPLDEFDSQADRIWNDCRDNYPISVKKNRDYLNWRYVRCPQPRYRTLAVILEARPIGYVVLKEGLAGEQHNFPNDRLAVIVDWILPQSCQEHHPAILKLCEALVSGDEPNRRLIVMFPLGSRERKLFQTAGYEEFKSRYKLAARSFHERIDLDELNDNWFYTLGDFDIV